MRLLFLVKEMVRRDFKSACRFLLVGFLTTLVYFSIFSISLEWLKVGHRFAVTFAYVIAATFQFFSNRRFTFKSHTYDVGPQVAKYISMLIINYIITFVVVDVCVRILHLSPYFGAIFAIGVVVFTGYFLSKFWVFRHDAIIEGE